MKTTHSETSAASSTGAPARAADVLIVGGGSAGAVLAARLSADPGRSVLLLEAGPSFEPGAYPAPLTDPSSIAPSDYDWHYHSDDKARLGHDIPLPRGRVLGGSSAVNNAIAVRARPDDFARWEVRGITGWSWNEVLPVFRTLENTESGAEDWHGRTGPFPIRVRSRADLTPSLDRFISAAHALGSPQVSDFNSGDNRGAGVTPLNVVDETRMNTAMTYLDAEVRARKNLEIRSGVEVDRLIVGQGRVLGVRAVGGEVIHAAEVVLSAGTFGSAAILLRSGIGPASHLQEMGIATVADLPVGERLFDHPFLHNVYALKPEAGAMRPAGGALLWTNSTCAEAGDLDIQITAGHYVDPESSPTGSAIIMSNAVTLPRSVGSLRLKSSDPTVMPRIHYNFFDDPSDLDRMVEIVELSRELGRTDPFRSIVEKEMLPGHEVRSEKHLRNYIVKHVTAYQHPTSTVPMGSDQDPSAVVDSQGRVKGLEGLRVVDASILPDIPSTPPHVTVLMLAERLARQITQASA